MMICYQDEKMYGPPVDSMTEEELDMEISKLEKEIYGDKTFKDPSRISQTPMIYNVETGKLEIK